MTNKTTLAAALFARLGYSRTEAATYLGVRGDTVKKWVAGKMDMPDQIETDLRNYIRHWDGFCQMEAEFYTTHFANEPYAIIAVPEDENIAGWGIPHSVGFIEATIGAIASHLDTGLGHIQILAETEVEKFVQERHLPKDHITAALHWVGMFDDMLGAQIGTHGMMQVTETTVDKLLDQLEVDQRWYSVDQNPDAPEMYLLTFKPMDGVYEGDISDEDTNAGYGFELWLYLFEDAVEFVGAADDGSAMRFRMGTGKRHDAGFSGDDGNGFDSIALNLHIERRLKQIFGTPAKMLKELSEKSGGGNTPWTFTDD